MRRPMKKKRPRARIQNSGKIRNHGNQGPAQWAVGSAAAVASRTANMAVSLGLRRLDFSR
jgi:hypothetical protein